MMAESRASADIPTGLSSEEARRRVDEWGPNEPVEQRRAAPLQEIAHLFSDPLVLLLLVASVVSALVGEEFDAALIAAMVLMGVALNAWQTLRSQHAAEQLRKELAPLAHVCRDGVFADLPRRALVPGDLVRLAAGDLVPADARLLEARDLHLHEAALTGESLPVERHALDTVFLGTSVASGTALAVVTATGPRTQFGAIAERVSRRPPETEFERGTRHLGGLITRTVVFLIGFVMLTSVVAGRKPLPSLLFAVALAVGLTPEFLPMISTITLGLGARRMASRDVLVKNLATIQNFGSIDILVSDKTGTLTSGRMAVAAATDPLGKPSERVLLLAALNSLHETGIRNPLDEAILAAGGAREDIGMQARSFHKVDEVPFDFERRRLSVVLERGPGGSVERLLIVKGAPEAVLEVCRAFEMDGQTALLADSADLKSRAVEVVNRAAAEGHRALAVAHRNVPFKDAYAAADETDLVLAGFLFFEDPPLLDAAETLAALRQDGVVVKLATGDHELVARHVAERVGLDASRIVLGRDMDGLSDDALALAGEETAVFARLSPLQKHRLIVALKARGHVVGFLGDGINDAPSLRAADVGISVSTAVAVAQDAADVILKRPGLAVLHNGIVEGRRAFGNVMKYLLMETSSNFGNMFSMAAAAIVLPFLPMLPTQILLNNFLYDLAQVALPTDRVDPTFTKKPRRWDIRLLRNFMLTIGPISSLYDFLTFYALLRVFHASEALFHTGWFVESLSTQALVVFVIRTGQSPLQSRPSRPLALLTLAVVATAVALPYSPLAGPLGFVPMRPLFLAFVLGVVATYLALVEVVKRRVVRGLVR